MNKPVQLRIPDEAHSPARFTTAEFLQIAEAGALNDIKLELIDGELERMPPPHGRHASRQATLIALLWQVACDHGLHLLGEVGIDLGGDTVVACDLALANRPIAEQRLVRPEELVLVVEIAESSLVRDTTLKRIAYAKAAIGEYWVVDGEQNAVRLYRALQDMDYKSEEIVAFGQPIAVPGTDATIVIE